MRKLIAWAFMYSLSITGSPSSDMTRPKAELSATTLRSVEPCPMRRALLCARVESLRGLAACFRTRVVAIPTAGVLLVAQSGSAGSRTDTAVQASSRPPGGPRAEGGSRWGPRVGAMG